MDNFQDKGVSLSGLENIMNPVCYERLDPDTVCPERRNPNPVNIRPDPKPCPSVSFYYRKNPRKTLAAGVMGCRDGPKMSVCE